MSCLERTGVPLILVQASHGIKTNFIHTAMLICVVLFGSRSSMAAPVSPDLEHKTNERASQVFEEARERIYQIRTLTADGDAVNSTGSGFLVGKDGLIATNWHVISDAILDPGRYRLEAIRTDGRHLPLSVVAIDAMNDLVLLRAADESGIPFIINDAPLVKGAKGFSLGNPSSIGFTVVEGTFNGVVAKSLRGYYHFTAAVNAGMSGGPALTTKGEVFGINVARLSDGNLISFLVPADRLVALIARARASNPSPEILLNEARQGIIDGQEKVTSDVLNTPPRMKQIGSFMVPIESGSVSRCNGSSSKEEEDGYSMESTSCIAEMSITAGRNYSAGVMWTEYRIVKNVGLDGFRFAARLSDQITNDYDDAGDRKLLARYSCHTSLVKLKSMTVQATICRRPYKQLDGLLDAHMRLVTVDSSEVALVGDLTLRGFTENNIKRLARWYLGTIEWKH